MVDFSKIATTVADAAASVNPVALAAGAAAVGAATGALVTHQADNITHKAKEAKWQVENFFSGGKKQKKWEEQQAAKGRATSPNGTGAQPAGATA